MMDRWESPDTFPVRDERFVHCSVDVTVLVAEMDQFGERKEVERKGYFHWQAHEWFVYFDDECTSEEPNDNVIAWRYAE